MFFFFLFLAVELEGVIRTGRDTLDTATASKTTDSGLGDTLDVVTQDLAMTLGATLAEALATFAACCLRRVSIGQSGHALKVAGRIDTHVQSF